MASIRLPAHAPFKDICAQDLMTLNHSHAGWLRKRGKFNSMSATKKIFPWSRKFVVLHDGCFYCYPSEMKNACSSFSLYGYDQVIRAIEIGRSEVPWAFKIIHKDPLYKTYYFSAPSEQHLKVWMKHLKREMKKANSAVMVRTDADGSETNVMAESLSAGSLTFDEIETKIYDDPNMIFTPCTNKTAKLQTEDSDEDDRYSDPEDFYVDMSFPIKLPFSTAQKPSPAIPHKAPPTVHQKAQPTIPQKAQPTIPQKAQPTIPQKAQLTIPQKASLGLKADASSTWVKPTKQPKPGILKPHGGKKLQALPDIPCNTTKTATVIPESSNINKIKTELDAVTMCDEKLAYTDCKSRSRQKRGVPEGRSVKKTSLEASQPAQRPDSPTVPTEFAPSLPCSKEKQVAEDPEAYWQSVIFNGDNAEANRIIRNTGEDGVYLVRCGTRGQVLLLYAKGGVYKYQIHQQNDTHYLNKDATFSTLPELLYHYHSNDLPVGVRLTMPYCLHPSYTPG